MLWENYALSCAFDNNFVSQKYFNEIFEVVRSGELLLEDVLMQVKTFEKQSGRKIDTSAITDLIEASKTITINLQLTD